MAGLDEPARHSITKFAHIHFPATKKSAERIFMMGEDAWRINTVGSPALDEILHTELFSKNDLEKSIDIKLDDKYILMVQHPVTTEPGKSESQIVETLEAIKLLGVQTVIIYPNSDSGGKAIIEKIREYVDVEDSKFKAYVNLSHKQYLSLMKYSSVLVGNSSSGMTESSSLFRSVVYLYLRQEF